MLLLLLCFFSLFPPPFFSLPFLRCSYNAGTCYKSYLGSNSYLWLTIYSLAAEPPAEEPLALILSAATKIHPSINSSHSSIHPYLTLAWSLAYVIHPRPRTTVDIVSIVCPVDSYSLSRGSSSPTLKKVQRLKNCPLIQHP